MKKSKRKPARSIILLFVMLGPACFFAATRAVAGEPGTEELPGIAEQEKILSLKPLGEDVPDWRARWEMARLLSYTRQYGEAIIAYRQVLEEKPELAEAKVELARVLYWTGKRQEALQVFESIPENKLDDTSRIILGDLYAFSKQYEKSIAIYSRFLKNRSTSPEVRLRLAEVLTWAKKYKEAIGVFREILKSDPNDIQARRKLAFVLSYAGDKEAAIEELKKTLP